MNKTVLVTGASSGIGESLTKYLLDKGYYVIGLSRKKPISVEFPYYECDLSNITQIKQTTTQILNDNINIDVLVNCAGVGTGGSIEDISYEDLKWVFDVNILGVIELIKGLLPVLKKNNKSKIINIGSVAGEITIPFQLSYTMTKSSLHKLTEGLRIELKPFGVDVASVLPGDTKTGFTKNRKNILPENSPYLDRANRSINKMAKDEQKGVSALKVVKVIEKLIRKKKMRSSTTVGFDYKILVCLSRILPKRLVEKIVMKMYG